MPCLDRDPAWTIVEHGVDPVRHRVAESLFTVTSGGVGLRGADEEHPGFGQPLVVAAGVYDGTGPETGLLEGPDVVDVALSTPVTSDVRTLDLRSGVLLREETDGGPVPLRSLRFGSVAEPGVFALRVEAAAGRLLPSPGSGDGATSWAATTASSGGIGAAAEDRLGHRDGVDTLERLVVVDACSAGSPDRTAAEATLRRVAGLGFDRLLAAQRREWNARWDAVDVRIPADPDAERALRFALFQLWGLASSPDGGGEVAVGARALTGSGYSGHVFWDADVFVLPALAAIAPEAAAGMVGYRLHRLAAARERAREEGRSGARFPWESALDGRDVTPGTGLLGGEQVAILTGSLEEHITADVAWGVVRNATWSRPRGRLTAPEAALLRDTARYWASRIHESADGAAHLERVIGPDEYHERVDDNAYTNVMARWNLRAAARLGGDRAEKDGWLRQADALVDGYDAGRGLHEQFRGYFGLEPLLVRQLAEPPVAADMLLGRERIAGSQVVKQPDVLMLHHVVPEELRPGTLAADFDFYAPRTAHGSSLSPGIMAAVAARAGRVDAALDLLRLCLRIDLDDLAGTTAAGVHIAACGGAWQAVLTGFLGARVVDGVLELDPVLPAAWPSLEARFRCLGRDVRVQVGTEVRVDASAPLRVRVGGRHGSAGEHVRLLGEPHGRTEP